MNYIYKITNNTNIYIGSTTNFKNRMSQHKHTCNTPHNKGYNLKVYTFIRNNGGWDNFTMEIIETTEKTGKELCELERYYIELLNADLNNDLPNRTRKEYYQDNKEKAKQYREDNKEKYKEHNKKYREENKNRLYEYKTKKVECSNCGCIVNRNDMARHKRTQKCLSYIKNNI